jgi:hypothetical protein
MSIAPCQPDPKSVPSGRAIPRPASGVEVPVPSPVHRLQAEIAAFGEIQDLASEDKLPGWMRVIAPVGASVLLWGGIAWIVGLVG